MRRNINEHADRGKEEDTQADRSTNRSRQKSGKVRIRYTQIQTMTTADCKQTGCYVGQRGTVRQTGTYKSLMLLSKGG